MALALYRKYRPQRFADLTDQVHIRVTLEHEITSGKIAHAYLFSGPRGVGKTTTARILAKAINCLQRDGAEPCLTCTACLAAQENRAVDILEIDAASHTGVDAVRENIIENVRFTPSQLTYKVYIIDEVHMLSTAAFNALLKTLEEPPAHAVFILATTETHKVPQTILSRCQRFDFRKISTPHLIERLAMLSAREEIDVAPDVLAAVARSAGGSLRDAESLLGQILAIGEKRISLEEASLVLPHSDITYARTFLLALSERRGGDAVRQIDALIADGVDLERFVADCQALIRLAMVAFLGETSGLADIDEESASFVRDTLARWPLTRLTRAVEVMMTAAERVKRGDGSPLPLELALAILLAEVESPIPASLPPTATPAVPNATIARAPTVVAPAPVIADVPNQEDQSPAVAVPETISSVVVDASPAPKAHNLQTSLDAFKSRWTELVVKVDEINHSLPLVLNACQPERIDGTTLFVAVPFAFHRDRLAHPKNQDILANAMQQLFGEAIRVEAVVNEGLQNPSSEVENVHFDDPVIKNVLDAFGGRVVS